MHLFRSVFSFAAAESVEEVIAQAQTMTLEELFQKAIEESNSNIMALLDKNKVMMDEILEGGKETEVALDKLRAAIKDHEMTIDELRTVNKKLTEQNLQLKHRAKEQEANMEALKQEKMALQKEIDRLREIANEILKIS